MKLKNTLALSLAAVMAAGLTACGSGADTASAASPAADSTAAESTEAAADTTAELGCSWRQGVANCVCQMIRPAADRGVLFLRGRARTIARSAGWEFAGLP